MRTERQIEASRINGARSRGPVTEAGRRKSSRKDVPIASMQPGTESGEISAIRATVEAQYPVPGSPDLKPDFLLLAALDAHQDRTRIVVLETRVTEEEIARQRLIHPGESDTTLAMLSFRRLADETGVLHALYRHEGAIMRRWERALERLRRRSEESRSVRPVLFRETNPAPKTRECEICGTNPAPVLI
jgi:hypothetical protein